MGSPLVTEGFNMKEITTSQLVLPLSNVISIFLFLCYKLTDNLEEVSLSLELGGFHLLFWV